MPTGNHIHLIWYQCSCRGRKVQELVARMANGEVLAVHCRGGVGRAGLLACCVMLYLSIAQTAETAIRQVRTRATQTSCWHGACT
mmetsp:Transcript_30386/g.78052  ORF Transcript_30386/g.78052 Transcript_30386/m.78052 type:complete len:85 (-) Transcript_30386:2313-2567(-)